MYKSDPSPGESPRRTDILAQPKSVPLEFRDDRRSVYWIDYIPKSSGGVTVIESHDQTDGGRKAFRHTDIVNCYFLSQAEASPRVHELARSKTIHTSYKWDRPTPVWGVSPAAQRASATARVETLSQPKGLSPLYLPERSAYMFVKRSATRTKSTPRLDALATARPKSEHETFRDLDSGDNYVTPQALRATASPRVEQLSESKRLHPLYQEEKQIQWTVSDPAMKATASLRLQQLARPRSRSLLKDDYDPYKVTYAARHARITPRLEELAIPFPRKLRKKIA